MKNRRWCWALVVLAVIVVLPGCLGPNHLGGHLGKWNQTEFESKWAQEGIFLLIFPAYVVCGLTDILVLNSIQWWWGVNPVSHPSQTFTVL